MLFITKQTRLQNHMTIPGSPWSPDSAQISLMETFSDISGSRTWTLKQFGDLDVRHSRQDKPVMTKLGGTAPRGGQELQHGGLNLNTKMNLVNVLSPVPAEELLLIHAV